MLRVTLLMYGLQPGYDRCMSQPGNPFGIHIMIAVGILPGRVSLVIYWPLLIPFSDTSARFVIVAHVRRYSLCSTLSLVKDGKKPSLYTRYGNSNSRCTARTSGTERGGDRKSSRRDEKNAVLSGCWAKGVNSEAERTGWRKVISRALDDSISSDHVHLARILQTTDLLDSTRNPRRDFYFHLQ